MNHSPERPPTSDPDQATSPGRRSPASANEASDPRVFFAAERTLLAWLRTGIATIGLGFLVARFGYFLRMMQGERPTSPTTSTLMGVALVFMGSLLIAAATWQHERFLRALGQNELPARYSARFAVVVSATIAVFGLALAGYLLLPLGSSPPSPSHSLPSVSLP